MQTERGNSEKTLTALHGGEREWRERVEPRGGSSEGRAAPSAPPTAPGGRPRSTCCKGPRGPGAAALSAQPAAEAPPAPDEDAALPSVLLFRALPAEQRAEGGAWGQQTPTRGCGGARRRCPPERTAGRGRTAACRDRRVTARQAAGPAPARPPSAPRGRHPPGPSPASRPLLYERWWWEGELGRLTKAAPRSEPPSPRPPSLNSCSERLRGAGLSPPPANGVSRLMRLEFEILVAIDRFASTLNSSANNDARSTRPYEARPMKGDRGRDRGGGRARPAVTGAGPGRVPLSAAGRSRAAPLRRHRFMRPGREAAPAAPSRAGGAPGRAAGGRSREASQLRSQLPQRGASHALCPRCAGGRKFARQDKQLLPAQNTEESIMEITAGFLRSERAAPVAVRMRRSRCSALSVSIKTAAHSLL
ncbi:scavenger receptor class F member 2 [Phasianus colchicus]|uniref:scavenger receptor class F member 2 n=1 Tax=Phasianus colchicus TaxID=9054 RepID=UPI00129DFFBD|nr:scavenger receptor class F member 2 [Phasianus colchicus]